MAKQRRHPKGGRTTPKGTRPDGYRPRHAEADPFWVEPPEPDLLGDVRRALADRGPVSFLDLVSALAASLDRKPDPFDRSAPAPAGPSRQDLLDTFVEIDRVETTALLAGFAALSTDEVERRRLERVVAGRAHHLPRWLTRLAEAEAEGAVELTHVLADGDNVIVGVRLATGEGITANVYIDHNLGTLVKDAYVIPAELDEAVVIMRANIDDPDMALLEMSPADAKVRIVEAIALTAMTYPPIETDSWPACRPLVEWMVRLLPDGGQGYQRPEWTDEERDELTERFFASGFGAPLDDEDNRGLLDSILWFGTGYGPGDPLRWSPVAVELLLADWIPRKIVADAEYLSKAPTLLRAFIRYCHAERGIRATLTDDTLAAVDEWEPEYQAVIRASRPQGVHAILAAMGAVDPYEYEDDADFIDELDEYHDHDVVIQRIIADAVGGGDALETLDDEPLPDEPFEWNGVPDDVHDRVAEVLGLVDGCCDELLDTEYRTACRRVLARIAANGPDVFRRRGRADTAAAAVCWSVLRANHERTLSTKALLEHFGVKSSVSDRAHTLLNAGGFPIGRYDFILGSPDYLVSTRRRGIIRSRNRRARRLTVPWR